MMPAQRESDSSGLYSAVPPVVSNVLSSRGQPFDSNTRQFMEERFGHDFSRVRLHTDGQAAASAQAMHARAYTVGRDVVFGQGQCAPATTEGKHLMAHEMAHVLQQENCTPSIMKFGLGLGGCVTTLPPEECHRPTGYSIEPGSAYMGTTMTGSLTFGMVDSPRIIEGESLGEVFVKELVSPSVNHEGSFVPWPPLDSVADEYENAAKMPDDNHLFPADIALQAYDNFLQVYGTGDGSISFLQMYIYEMHNCGLKEWTVLPNSGYRITHTLQTGNNGEVVAFTSKTAESVTIKEYSTKPGLTNRIRPVKNQLRP
jgi:hypothetical protein